MRNPLRALIPSRERNRALVFGVVWVLSLLALWGAISAIAPRDIAPAGTIHAALVIRGPAWTITYAPSTHNNSAFGLLREANVTLGFELRWVEYGWPYNDVYVTSINGTANDGARGVWWQYCVDGTYASVGARNQAIHEGDVIKWVYAAPGGSDLCA